MAEQFIRKLQRSAGCPQDKNLWRERRRLELTLVAIRAGVVRPTQRCKKHLAEHFWKGGFHYLHYVNSVSHPKRRRWCG